MSKVFHHSFLTSWLTAKLFSRSILCHCIYPCHCRKYMLWQYMSQWPTFVFKRMKCTLWPIQNVARNKCEHPKKYTKLWHREESNSSRFEVNIYLNELSYCEDVLKQSVLYRSSYNVRGRSPENHYEHLYFPSLIRFSFMFNRRKKYIQVWNKFEDE